MGTYTANKELYMPTVGETGWGTLVNGNFETIDNFLKPITVSGSTYTFTGNQTGGSVSATSIANSGTLTNTGKITANGGIGTTSLTTSSTITSTGKITANGGIGTTSLTTSGTITSTGKITANGGIAGGAITGTTITASDRFNGTLYGKVYVNAKTTTTKYNNDVTYATCAVQSIQTRTTSTTAVTSKTLTVNGYSKISMSYPYQLYSGIYIPSSGYFTDNVPSNPSRTVTFSITVSNIEMESTGGTAYLYVNGTRVKSVSRGPTSGTTSDTYTVKKDDSVYLYVTTNRTTVYGTLTINAASNYYINVV